MLKVGITGGIGSGKTIVARIFQLLGVPVYFADDAAKQLMNQHLGIRQALVENFGTFVYQNESLDRAALASVVFNRPEKLKLLNSIVHPVVINDAKVWMERQISPVVMKEAAIFFESGSYIEMDFMIGVYAPKEVRMQRAVKRDNTTEKAVEERMARQMNEEEKMSRCDFVLKNDEQDLLIPQVISLHKKLLELAVEKQ